VALLSLLQNTARIKESRAALIQARRTTTTPGCPVKIGEPVMPRISPFGAHGSYLTRLSGGGTSLTVRVVEYYVC